MPIYELRCLKCNFRFEELLSLQENLPKCPKCNEETEKVVSRFSGVVKGSTNRTIDSIVGESSEKRWQSIEKRRAERKINPHKKYKVIDKPIGVM